MLFGGRYKAEASRELREGGTGLKKIILVAIALVILSAAFILGLHIKKVNAKFDALKPHVMFEGNLYGIYISPDSNITGDYEIEIPDISDKESLKFAGTITEIVNQIPQKNFQANNAEALLGGKIYLADSYPNYLFILDEGGDYWIYSLG